MIEPKNILLLLLDGFEVYEAAAFADVFGWNKEEGDGSTNLVTIGFDATVKAAFGQSWQPNLNANNAQLDTFDALAIPGGFSAYGFFEAAFSEQTQQLVKTFAKNQKPIATICVGSLVLAQANLLSNTPATTYPFNQDRIKQLTERKAIYCNQEVVISGNLIMGQHPAAAMQTAFSLLTALTNEANTNHVKKLMGF